MSEEITQIPHDPPTKEELCAFIDTHVAYMSKMVNKWLLQSGDMLKDCDVYTRRKIMDSLVFQLKKRIHYL
jgi:hypothetical protein